MANKHTTATANANKDGHHLSIQQHETDSPILPVAQLEQLQRFKPDAVDWVINQTQIEAEHRRTETIRINHYTFIRKAPGDPALQGGEEWCAFDLYFALFLPYNNHCKNCGHLSHSDVNAASNIAKFDRLFSLSRGAVSRPNVERF